MIGGVTSVKELSILNIARGKDDGDLLIDAFNESQINSIESLKVYTQHAWFYDNCRLSELISFIPKQKRLISVLLYHFPMSTDQTSFLFQTLAEMQNLKYVSVEDSCNFDSLDACESLAKALDKLGPQSKIFSIKKNVGQVQIKVLNGQRND